MNFIWMPLLTVGYLYMMATNVHAKLSAAEAVEVLQESRGGKRALSAMRDSKRGQQDGDAPDPFRPHVTQGQRKLMRKAADDQAAYIKDVERNLRYGPPVHDQFPVWGRQPRGPHP